MAEPDLPPGAAGRLLDLGRALAASRGPDALLPLVLDATTGLLRCERAGLLLYDAAEGRLRFAAATGERAEVLARLPVPLDRSLAGTAFREDRPVLTDAERDERHFVGSAGLVGFRPRLVLSVPMRRGGRPIGVLQALNPHAGAFAEGDADALLALAALGAAAIHAAAQAG
jgi:GAF domain-containing protein